MQLQSIYEHNELYVQINDPIYDMIYISYIHLFIETSHYIFNNFIIKSSSLHNYVDILK